MEVGLRFELLGPVRAWRGDREVELGPPQQRALLALLLLRNGAPASAEELIGALWQDDLPRTAAGMIRSYVSRLRQVLAEETILSKAGGYALPARDATLDLRCFTRGLAAAREARLAGDTTAAAAALREALSLWQGAPMAGVTGSFAVLERTRLQQLRVAAIEDLAAAEIELGRPAEVLDALSAVAAEHPFRERPRELLMLALYQSGRQAEALAVFRDARATLQDQLGIEPGPALQEMHTRILVVDPALATLSSPKRLPPPAQTPADLLDFVGRADALHQVVENLRTADRGIPVVGVAGIGGVGKTALAIRAAHDLAEAFPDGQVFVEAEPAAPSEVLAGLLRTITDASLPASLAERSALWRSLTTGRRMLIVIDDVRDGALVRHVLPGSAASAVLLTARQRLAEASGVRWLTLGPLTDHEAMTLMERVVGGHRIRAEPVAAQRIITATAGLPQAVRAVAFRIAARPQWSLVEAADRILAQTPNSARRPSECAVIESPYADAMCRLPADVAQAFRLLAVPETAEISLALAAAVLVVSQHEAENLLEALADAHLLEPVRAGHYRYLKPVLVFARGRAMLDDGQLHCQAVLARWHAYRGNVSCTAHRQHVA